MHIKFNEAVELHPNAVRGIYHQVDVDMLPPSPFSAAGKWYSASSTSYKTKHAEAMLLGKACAFLYFVLQPMLVARYSLPDAESGKGRSRCTPTWGYMPYLVEHALYSIGAAAAPVR